MEKCPRMFPLLAAVGVMFFLLAACGQVELSSQEHMRRAQDYYERGEIRAAVIELKNAVQKDPRNGQVRRRLGELYLLQENGPSAEKELRRALELGEAGPRVRLALLKVLLLEAKFEDALELEVPADALSAAEKAQFLAARGEAYLGAGERDKAAMSFREALAADPSLPEARLGEVRVAMTAGLLAEAELKLDALVTADPGFAEAWLLKGRIALAQGQVGEALEALRQALANADPAARGLRQSIRVAMVIALVGQNSLAEAETLAADLRREAPNHYLTSYLQGLVAFRGGDYEEANTRLQEAYSANSDFMPAVLLLGAVNYALGSYHQAETHLNRYVQKVPVNLQAQKLLAAVRIKTEQPDKAIETLREALDLSPEDRELLAMTAMAAVRSGDVSAGRNYLERLIAEGGNSGAVRNELAKVYLSKGNPAQAIEELKRSLAEAPGAVETEILLTVAHLQRNELDEAEQVALAAAEAHPGNVYVGTLLGEIQLARNDLKAARSRFQEVLETREFPQARLDLATVAMREGKPEEARSHYEKVHQGGGDFAVNALMGLAELSMRQGEESAAVSWLEEARSLKADALAPRLALAQYYLRKGDAEQAVLIASEALLASKDPSAALALLSEAQIAAGRPEEAAASLGRLIEHQPERLEIQLRLGQVQAKLERWDAARSTFQGVLKRQPDYYPAMASLALLEQRRGDSGAALDLAADIKRRQPDSAVGYALEGDLRMLQGDARRAAQAYADAFERQASSLLVIKQFQALSRYERQVDVSRRPLLDWLKDNPQDNTVRVVLANSYAGDDPAQARNEYERILQTQPDHPVALNNLAWLYHVDGDPRALDFAERAYRLRPGDPAISDTLGWILVQEEMDVTRGLELLRTANRKMPHAAEVRYHLAVALDKSGSRKEARELLKDLLESGEDFKQRAAAEDLLARIDGD